MKFKDIKPIHNPHYRVSASLKYLELDLAHYIDRFGLDLNPDFQREYVWTYQQQIDYVEFVFKDPPTGREIYFNHSGWMDNFKGEMIIVDGKQRLNALICFMQNRVPIFGKNYLKDFEDNLGAMEPSVFFNINNLKQRKDILQWYIDLNTGGTVHTNVEIYKVKELLNKCI